MAEYISRDDALLHSEIIRVYSKDYGNIDVVPVEYLADIPAADVLPIKYGEWIFQGQYDKEGRRIYHCYECNFEVKVFPYNFIAWRTHEKYCCGCGARMDGVRNEK